MAYHKIIIRPGQNIQFTPALNESGWSLASFIRFKDGLAEKVGGWQHISTAPLVGTARGVHAWADLNGNPYLAAGTEQRLQLFSGGSILDITPTRATHNVTPSFSTTSGSATVKVTDTGHGANQADWVNIVVPVSVGGLILQGLYLIQSIVDGNNYNITAASNATATVANGGAVPAFATTSGSPNVAVTFANHGLITGSLFTVQVSTTVGGITMNATYPVQSVTDSSHFVIAPGTSAGSTTTGSENGGNAQLKYLIPSGLSSATALSGYGAGDYGSGDYGVSGSGVVVQPLRQWFLDNFGQDLVGNYTNGPAFYWVPPPGSSNVAIQIPYAPLMMAASFVAMPAAIMVALGAETGGTQDPNLIRWSDAGDFGLNPGSWTASATNQAGSFRLSTGSKIVGGIQAPQQGLIWTDIDLWAMQYVQPPFVFGFTKIAAECGLIAGHAVGIIGNSVVWMSQRNFYIMDANGVRVLPCSVWDFVFKNLNITQSDKIFAAVNSLFNEIAFFFPSASGNGEIDSYAKFNVVENVWDSGNLVRTSWADESSLGPPIGIDINGILQQHDVVGVYDADGVPIDSFAQTGYFLIGEGTFLIFVERLIPDFIFGANSSVNLSVYVTDYPGDTPSVFGPFPVTSTTESIIVRARGRYMALRVESPGLGTFWRMGAPLHNGIADGRR